MRVAPTIAALLLTGCAVLALVKSNAPARSLFNVPMALPHGGWMPQSASRFMPPQMQHGGKGFGGGEATRDPAPTEIDPNDPKAKQTAIHKAESFADYLAKRSGGGGGAAPAPAPPAYSPPAAAASSGRAKPEGGKGFGGGEATRDPAPTVIDPNDPKGKQQAIHKAESFSDYLAKRKAAGGGAIGSAQ
jgi:rRNA maturation protein Nop10